MLAVLEVYGIIIPGAILLILYALPIPFIVNAVSGLVRLIERPNLSGITTFLGIFLMASLLFTRDFYTWNTNYGTQSKSSYGDIAQKFQMEAKRLRVERNLYVHACVACLALSLRKLAQLNYELLEARKRKEKTD